MSVLVDSSVWIDYFRGSEKAAALDLLIEEDLLAVNDLIIAQNAIQNNQILFSLDRHFGLIGRITSLSMFGDSK